MPEIPIGGNFYKSDSLPVSAQECVNLFAVIPETTTTTKKYLVGTPGIDHIATTSGFDPSTAAGADAERLLNYKNVGAHVYQGVPYFVNLNTLGSFEHEVWKLTRSYDTSGASTYGVTEITTAGTAPTADGRVMMADNGTEGGQIVFIQPSITTQFNAWIINAGAGTYAAISDADFDGPVSSVVFIDGYFSFTKANSQKFFVSNLRDGTAYISTDFGSAESDPDSIVGQAVLNNNLFIFGSQTFEIFQNIGGSGFPFQRIPGSVQQKGLANQFCVQESDGALIFLGKGDKEQHSVWATDGGLPVRVSTHAIDREIASYPASAIAGCYSLKHAIEGREFVSFTFPEYGCLVYEASAKLWHKRMSLDSLDQQKPWRVSSIVDAYESLIVGDTYSPKVGTLSNSTYTEFDESILRWFVTPHLDNEGMPFFINSIELVCESGTGLKSGQGSDPVVWMSMSTDGGHTFPYQRDRKTGKIGEYFKRVIWNRLGRVKREVCFRFAVSDPVKWVFRKIEANLE